MRAAVHDDVGAAVGLAQHDRHPRHRGPGVGEGELGAVADHPAPLEVLARVEAGRVDEGEQREAEGVAEGHEPGALLRGRDVERAGDRHRLVGDDADRPAADRGEGGDEVRRPARAQLEQLAVVDDGADDVAHVVAAGGGGGDARAGLGGRPVDGIVGPPARRLLVDVRGQVGEQVAERLRGAASTSATTRAATPVLEAWTPAPPSSVASSDSPVKVSTMRGPLTKA